MSAPESPDKLPDENSLVDDLTPEQVLDIVGPSDEETQKRDRLPPGRQARKDEATPFEEEEPWPEEVEGASVLDEVVATLNAFMVLPPVAADAIALWVAHTYVFDMADFTPYLLVTSPARQCGKSTLLELLTQLAFRPQLTAGISAAALYRRIDRLRPTMLIDEIDTRIRLEGSEALRGVLDSGFHRSGGYTICVGDGHQDKTFATYCPKVLAGIGEVWDTVASRSIPIRLARASRAELSGRRKIRGDRIRSECEDLRRKLLRWAEQLREVLHVADTQTPDELGARESDIWRILFALADEAKRDWRKRAEHAARELHKDGDDEGDDGLQLLRDIRDLFARTGQVRLPSSFIADELGKMIERRWSEFRNGKPITQTGVANILRRFDIHPKSIRTPDRVHRGYELESFYKAFERYLAAPEKPATPATGE